MTSRERKKFPFEFKPLPPEETAKLKENYKVTFEFTRLEPGGFFFGSDYKYDAENIYNMSMKHDDVVVLSYPRSGTTWTQEMVWLIQNDLNYEVARAIPLTKRYTFVEFSAIFSFETPADKDKGTDMKKFDTLGSKLFENSPSPRFLKTHLPLSLLPPDTLDTAKVVYVARDPRDVAVSFYHQHKLFKYSYFSGDFKQFWDWFRDGLILWCPFFEHVKAAWALRHHPNMLFLFYEDISNDLPGTIARVAEFFGKQLTEEQIAHLSNHLSFDNFKNNNAVNFSELKEVMNPNESFIRKGQAGGWRDKFDTQMREEAEQWIADNLQDTDLRFPNTNS